MIIIREREVQQSQQEDEESNAGEENKFEEVDHSQSKYDEEGVDSQMSQEISRYTPSKQQNLIKVESESSEEAEENEKILHHKQGFLLTANQLNKRQ